MSDYSSDEDLGNDQPANKEQAKLSYKKVLKKLQDLRKNKSKLSEKDKLEIKRLFEQAKSEVNNDKDNVNTPLYGNTLLELAAEFDNTDTINYLLTNHLAIILNKPNNLTKAITFAAKNGYKKSLGSLVKKDILEELKCNFKNCHKEFDNITGELTTLKETPEVKDVAAQALITIENINQYSKNLSEIEKFSNRIWPLDLKDKQTINKLFENTVNIIKTDKVNVNIINVIKNNHTRNNTLIEFAAEFGNIDTINYLLTNHLEKLLDKPFALSCAISEAMNKTKYEAFGLLVKKDILEKLRYNSERSKEVFDKIENDLTGFKNDEDAGVSQEVKGIITQALATIEEINRYPEVLKELEKLSTQEHPDQDEIDQKFAEAIQLVTNNNINYEHSKDNLMTLAIDCSNVKTIKHLLVNHLNSLTPLALVKAIQYSAANGHDKALELLIKSPAALNKVIAQQPNGLIYAVILAADHQKALKLLLSNDKIINAIIKSSGKKNLKDALEARFEDKKDQLDHIVKTRDNLVLKRNIKTVLAAGVAGSAVAGGTFVGALVAKKGLKLFKDTRLVTNCLLPAFNKVNDQLMIDLNKIAKAFTDPKIAGLIVGVIAILGAITSALGVGAMAHKKQGGTILGR